jgi:hypothetical protein
MDRAYSIDCTRKRTDTWDARILMISKEGERGAIVAIFDFCVLITVPTGGDLGASCLRAH